MLLLLFLNGISGAKRISAVFPHISVRWKLLEDVAMISSRGDQEMSSLFQIQSKKIATSSSIRIDRFEKQLNYDWERDRSFFLQIFDVCREILVECLHCSFLGQWILNLTRHTTLSLLVIPAGCRSSLSSDQCSPDSICFGSSSSTQSRCLCPFDRHGDRWALKWRCSTTNVNTRKHNFSLTRTGDLSLGRGRDLAMKIERTFLWSIFFCPSALSSIWFIPLSFLCPNPTRFLLFQPQSGRWWNDWSLTSVTLNDSLCFDGRCNLQPEYPLAEDKEICHSFSQNEASRTIVASLRLRQISTFIRSSLFLPDHFQMIIFVYPVRDCRCIEQDRKRRDISTLLRLCCSATERSA